MCRLVIIFLFKKKNPICLIEILALLKSFFFFLTCDLLKEQRVKIPTAYSKRTREKGTHFVCVCGLKRK